MVPVQGAIISVVLGKSCWSSKNKKNWRKEKENEEWVKDEKAKEEWRKKEKEAAERRRTEDAKANEASKTTNNIDSNAFIGNILLEMMKMLKEMRGTGNQCTPVPSPQGGQAQLQGLCPSNTIEDLFKALGK